MTPDIEQVKLAIATIAEATLILRQFGNELTEPAMMVDRGVGEVRRIVNNYTVDEHIRNYRLQQQKIPVD